MKNKTVVLMLGILALIVLAGEASAAIDLGGYTSVNHQIQPDFQVYYSDSQIKEYWPSLKDDARCEARQDLLLMVSPGGCQPAVVRSDLLAEQNVPVFCQIDALKLNPLIDIKQIKNIRFTGDYPAEVAGTGFHPAAAALRTTNNIMVGSPLTGNIGYVVVILKKNEKESELPDYVNVTLTAELEYDVGNAFGIGQSEFNLRVMDDEEWKNEGVKNTFWNGIYAVRLTKLDSEQASISIYKGENVISSTTVQLGKTSGDIYLSGSYCSAALNIQYSQFRADDKRVSLEIYSGAGKETLDAYEGTKFLNGKCRVNTITLAENNGQVSLRCGSQSQTLRLQKAVSKEIIDDALSEDSERVFKEAIDSYLEVANLYSKEKRYPTEVSETYGEVALLSAVKFIETDIEPKGIKKDKTKAEILQKFREMYPDSIYSVEVEDKLARLEKEDSLQASWNVVVDNSVRTIILKDFKDASSKGKNISDFILNENVENIKFGFDKVGGAKAFSTSKEKSLLIQKVVLKSIASDDEVVVSVTCRSLDANKVVVSETKDIIIGEGERKEVCPGQTLRLNSLEFTRVAQIRIIPKAKGTATQTNVTVNIGIEKRAIQLTPEQALSRIKTLNESIARWEKISGQIGKITSGLQGACIATGLILTVKNLITGIGGTAIARQETMDKWTKTCNNDLSKYGGSMSKCLGQNKATINSEIDTRTTAIGQVNADVAKVEAVNGVSSGGGLISESSVNQDQAKSEYLKQLQAQYGNDAEFDRLFVKNDPRAYTYTDLRDWQYNKILSEKKVSGADANLESIGKKVDQGALSVVNFEKASTLAKQYDSSVAVVGQQDFKSAKGTVMVLDSSGSKLNGRTLDGLSGAAIPKEYDAGMFVHTNDGDYLVVGNKDGNALDAQRVYNVQRSAAGEKLNVTGGSDVDITTFRKNNKISTFENALSYNNEINSADRVVRFFESGVDSGKAALVPFDVKGGWYVKVKQSLSVGNQLPAYETSGLPKVWHICNVGLDKRVGNDDECQQVIEGVSTGYPVLGLGTAESARLVRDSRTALIDATRQKGSSIITIGGQKFSSGAPVQMTDSVQCQQFMTIDDCNLLFNICDPVICPASRCNFGGQYPVPDVIQSGIIGSIFLCLPNFGNPLEGGVIIPVCLTGIQAGLDGYVSILKSYAQCLQESVDTGKTVGICDEIHSIYLCEFFWRQISPFTSLLIPNLIETFYTGNQGARGGGEYLTVSTAWQNAQQSMNYFTTTYGGNALQAFNIRDIDSILQSAICKKEFISLKAPTSFESMLDTYSPVQFTAWFSQTLYSDITIPATSQYKVFYHIYAGKTKGSYYNVYLKNPPQGTYSTYPPTVQVASGYVPQGDFKTETKDFTAPQGYKELCVSIDGNEKCGFEEVSTSFAINQLADNYAASQMNREDIKTESECVSGSPSGGALVNPNIMAGAEESVFPRIYNRGIVRICASVNPGQTTAPSRFKEVGYCDDKNVKCWLDLNSIDEAITDSNLGLKSKTLQNLQGEAAMALAVGGLDSEDAATGKIKSIESEITAVDVRASVLVDTLKAKIETLAEKIYLDYQKARLGLAGATLNAKIANVVVLKPGTPVIIETAMAPSSEVLAAEAAAEAQVNEFGVPIEMEDLVCASGEDSYCISNYGADYKCIEGRCINVEFLPLGLSVEYGGAAVIDVENAKNEKTGITLSGGQVNYNGARIGSVSYVGGSVQTWQISLLSGSKTSLDEIDTDLFDYLKDSRIEVGESYIDPRESWDRFEEPEFEFLTSAATTNNMITTEEANTMIARIDRVIYADNYNFKAVDATIADSAVAIKCTFLNYRVVKYKGANFDRWTLEKSESGSNKFGIVGSEGSLTESNKMLLDKLVNNCYFHNLYSNQDFNTLQKAVNYCAPDENKDCGGAGKSDADFPFDKIGVSEKAISWAGGDLTVEDNVFSNGELFISIKSNWDGAVKLKVLCEDSQVWFEGTINDLSGLAPYNLESSGNWYGFSPVLGKSGYLFVAAADQGSVSEPTIDGKIFALKDLFGAEISYEDKSANRINDECRISIVSMSRLTEVSDYKSSDTFDYPFA